MTLLLVHVIVCPREIPSASVITQHRYVIYLRQSGSESVSESVSKTLRLPPHGFASDPDTDTDSESNWATAAYAE
ncbi:hypothetical protein JCM31598_16820 [Desulfonatronum parangueonense]